jgi:broad specificity phosphatase PhoE
MGEEQAELTARRLSSVPARVIYSSDLERAIKTAQLIRSAVGDVPYEQDRELRECLPPCPAVSLKWPAERLEEGERHAESAFIKYVRPSDRDTCDIIVSHGNMIRYMTARVLGVSSSWCRMRTLNCGITELEIESDGTMWVVSYNDVGHLPTRLITSGLPAPSPV